MDIKYGYAMFNWCMLLAASFWLTSSAMAVQSTSANYAAQPGLFANGGGQSSSANYRETGALVGLWFARASSSSTNYQSGNPVSGTCGSDDSLTLTVMPTNLCTAGTASSVISSNSSYDWSCGGINGGSNASCLATRNYVVSTSVSGGNGSISANQNVAYNAAPSFTLTPGAGYVAGPVSGTCGGTRTGNSYTTNAVTVSCTVVASFTASSAGHKTYTAPSPTTSGNISASFTGGGTGCGYLSAQFIPLTGHAASPPVGSAPRGVSFHHGLFDFTTGGCTAGSTIAMTVTYPAALPTGTVYWKYGPTPTDAVPHWYRLPATIAGNTITFSITDGGLGDDDLTANGSIVDPGGISVGGGTMGIPTLTEWALLMLAGLMALFGMGAMRRRLVVQSNKY